jgi:hypothetical protein
MAMATITPSMVVADVGAFAADTPTPTGPLETAVCRDAPHYQVKNPRTNFGQSGFSAWKQIS